MTDVIRTTTTPITPLANTMGTAIAHGDTDSKAQAEHPIFLMTLSNQIWNRV
jgi:hypothetical protein